jgi:hypothetical protein
MKINVVTQKVLMARELREHPTSNIHHPTSNHPGCAPWMLDGGCWMLDVSQPCVAKRRRRQRAYFLIEALVYISVIMALLGVGYAAMYRCIDSTLALRRNAEDIASALHAGERWRVDVRASTAQPRVEDTQSGQLLVLDSPRGPVTYRFGTNGVSRRLGETAWMNLLPRVKSSAMTADRREHVTAWRWELELQPRVTGSMKPGHVRPLFTFIAVPKQPESK